MLSAIMPCCMFDKCEELNATTETSKSYPLKDCNNCSPFSVCAAQGFMVTHENITVEPADDVASLHYNHYNFSSKPGYYFSHFQPPRNC